MGLIKINGIQLFVAVKGAGFPIILVHGVGGDHLAHLKNLIKPLSKSFKTIALDCRGHGQSDKPSQFTIEDHANDILGIMDHFGIEKAHLLGVSMGSYIAQLVAIRAPDRIDKLILTVTKSNGLTSSVQRLFKENEAEIKGLDMHSTIVKLLKYMVYDPELMKNHLEIFETTLSPEQFDATNKAIGAFDFRKDLSMIKAKTLVISGKYDGLNPPADGKEVASLIKNARFVEMKYSGHAPMFEEPKTYLDIVEHFLAQ
ncbi:alpha/beta fold hydrolase [Mucilaginibacter gotjawali]|uniref:3-oxoadipate enol-lactonase n=2 Tax=Mucilaginibacter gotjawali TaxID=1550579 RepID=A0A839SJ13_9SPHI|nr:alpha/beta hydrolase [Mucilaginibacter gotjawali]MBB3057826.1 3-oxoadipate enol-lactonase [Mucilaginibacter gotjawali]BAU52627.1 putative non-heme bromoperoxidase BpoC [Mucilaginibacter gotjawali]